MLLRTLIAFAVCTIATRVCAFGVDSPSDSAEALLSQYCLECHTSGGEEGGVALDLFLEQWSDAGGDPVAEAPLRKTWSRALSLIRADVMPPGDAERPSDEEVEQLADWVKYRALRIDPKNPDPGRLTLRRLNRNEYRNTVRDLMGVDFDANEAFPADDTGHGFDNIADVLTVSPLLLEKYINAAKQIVSEAVPKAPKQVAERTIRGGDLIGPGIEAKVGWRELSYYKPADIGVTHESAFGGRYEIVVDFRADENYVEGVSDLNKCRLRFDVDGETLQDRQYARKGGEDYKLKFQVDWRPGPHEIRCKLEPVTPQIEQVRSLRITLRSVTLRGPLEEEHWVEPPNYRKWFPRDVPSRGPDKRAYARELLEDFAARAFRRPVPSETLERLIEIVRNSLRQGETFEAGVAQAMVAVLASPRFLYREEASLPPADQDSPKEAYPLIDEHALANRLSYFLWSTMPDEELLQLANEGVLRKRLNEQVDRMLADWKSYSLFTDFVGQWLRARDVEGASIQVDAVLERDALPQADLDRATERLRSLSESGLEELSEAERTELDTLQKLVTTASHRSGAANLDWPVRFAMRRETELHFEHILREGKSVLDLLDCDYAFLNEPLARHYGIKGVSGDEMRRVELPPDSPRGGLLTQGTLLITTSNPNRTAPVKRGLFILSNLLGTPPPPAPPNIPALEASEGGGDHPTTLRRSLEIHRKDPMCSSCHARMDPLGLALENFNAMGLYREAERDQPIEPSGVLISGERFRNISELKQVLATQRKKDFYRCLSEKLLTYALGRGLEPSDIHTVDLLVDGLDRSGGDLKGLIEGVIESAPFQRRRGAPDLLSIGRNLPDHL